MHGSGSIRITYKEWSIHMRRGVITIASILSIGGLLWWAQVSPAAQTKPVAAVSSDIPLEQVVIVLQKDVTAEDLEKLLTSLDASVLYQKEESRYYILQIPQRDQDDLLRLIAHLSSDKRILRATPGAFSASQDRDRLVTGDGAPYPINEVLVALGEKVGFEEARRVASLVKAKIVGVAPATNLYQLRIPTSTLEELKISIKVLERDDRVLFALPNQSLEAQHAFVP